MSNPVKIASFELENVKRIKLVELEPTENGLTIIGGRNNQGKTSVLDSLAWALGGNKFKPTKEKRDGSTLPPNLKVTLTNGIVVERKGKNSDLKVTDPTGKRSGQRLLDGFIEELALNLPKFINSNAKEKGKAILDIIGVGAQLTELSRKYNDLYNKRLLIGQNARAKKAIADELPYYENVPDDLVSINDLIVQQQAILAKNGENARKRNNVAQYQQQLNLVTQNIESVQNQLNELLAKRSQLSSDLEIAQKDIVDLHDESTEELEANIRNIESINEKVRHNLKKSNAEDEARQLGVQYDDLTKQLEKIEQDKMNLLKNADLPLPELSVNDEGEIIYKGQPWDNMSGSDQLKVATAIVRKLNPKCGFVFMDKLEQMDTETLQEFGSWLQQEGLQVIATRVSTGDECSIIIEDGRVKEDRMQHDPVKTVVNAEPKVEVKPQVDWKKGW